ncbi:MAG: hypothetical protein SGBAC_002231 [Bacillariaceae sp.]
MVDSRSVSERSWASVGRKPDVEQREGSSPLYNQESLQRHVDVLNKKLEIYRSREAINCSELDKMRDEGEKKEKTYQDLKQSNQLLVKKVVEHEKEIGLMRERLKDNREQSINLSKKIFTIKQQKGFDDKSQKLREENSALKRELIQIRAKYFHIRDPTDDGENAGKSKAPSYRNEEKRRDEGELVIENARNMGLETLKWQLFASQENDDTDVDLNGCKVKWTQARSAKGGADFVSFQNEVEEVCQELQEKTSLIQKLRTDLRKREKEFSSSFNKSLIEANESLAKVKEETAETITMLQAQLLEKENIENFNAELKSQVESLQSEKKAIFNRFGEEEAVKDKQLHALEKTLQIQDEVTKNMKAEIQEVRNEKDKLSLDKTEETRDLQLQNSALKAEAQALEETVTEMNTTLERQNVDYLAQVQSLQLIIEELESEGPLVRAIEILEKTEVMTEVRLRVGDLKAMNQRLQEENLKLGFQMDATALKLKKMDALEEESKELKTEFARMKEQLDLLQSPMFNNVQNENIMLREKLKFIAKELRRDEINCLVEEAKEWKKQASDASVVTSFRNLSGKSTPENGMPMPMPIDEASARQGCDMISDRTAKGLSDSNEESMDNDKWL